QYHDYVHHRENKGNWYFESAGLFPGGYQEGISSGSSSDRFYRGQRRDRAQFSDFPYHELCVTECSARQRSGGGNGPGGRGGNIGGDVGDTALAGTFWAIVFRLYRRHSRIL